MRLPDNAREAFQFLALGAAAIILVRLIYAGAEFALAPDASDGIGMAVSPYRSGYLLNNTHTVVLSGSGLFMRIAVGAMFAVAGGISLAAIGALMMKACGLSTTRGAVLGGRTGLLLASIYAIVAALALPPRSMILSEHGLILHDRSAILGTLGAPWPCAVDTIPWDLITHIDVRDIARSYGNCASDPYVVVTTMAGTEISVPPIVDPANCDVARTCAEQLAGVMRTRPATTVAH